MFWRGLVTNGKNQDDVCVEELGKVNNNNNTEIKRGNRIIKAKHQAQQGNSWDKGVPSETGCQNGSDVQAESEVHRGNEKLGRRFLYMGKWMEDPSREQVCKSISGEIHFRKTKEGNGRV